MARIRSIKPELLRSRKVNRWPREVRYAFVCMLMYLDDHGRGIDDPRLVKGECFAYDDDVSAKKVDGWLWKMTDDGPLCRYVVDGETYLHAVNWKEHQRPAHPTKSKVPPCSEHDHGKWLEWLDDDERYPVPPVPEPPNFTRNSRAARERLLNDSSLSKGAREQGSKGAREQGGSSKTSPPPMRNAPAHQPVDNSVIPMRADRSGAA